MRIWTGFIMPAYRKARPTVLYLLCHLVTLGLISLDVNAAVSGIEIRSVESKLSAGLYLIDAEMDIELSEESRKALVHGIPLRLDIEIRIVEERKWLWNKTLFSKIIIYRLSYQPLTRYYIVTNISNGKRQQFFAIDNMLEYLGAIRNQPLLEFERVPPDKRYTGLFRAKLNLQSLPTPLKPLAYLSSQWHLTSPWYEWKLE